MEVLLHVTMKEPKKAEEVKKSAEVNRKKKEELAQVAKDKESEPKLSYDVGAVIAVVALGLLGYYIYQ